MILAAVVDQAAKSEMGDIIRAAVAPVFLLSGIGAFVLVLTQRLARVMDRLHADGHDAVRDPAGRDRAAAPGEASSSPACAS